MRTLFYTLFIFIYLGSGQVFGQGFGIVEGRILDKESQEPIIWAQAALYENGVLVAGSDTDFIGDYSIEHILPGIYVLEVSYVGYETVILDSVVVISGRATRVDAQLSQGISLDCVSIIEFKKPLIEIDNTSSGGTLTTYDIENLSTKNINALAALTAGLPSENKSINVRSSRTKGTEFYLDGIRVRGNGKNAPNSITTAQHHVDRSAFVGKLTATEVNDFADWDFWSIVKETDFFYNAEQWKLNPLDRYAVQVQNDFGQAIMGLQVKLVDVDDNVLWAAVTDNLGRAELFHSFSKDQARPTHIQIWEDGERVKEVVAREFDDEIQIISVKAQCRKQEAIELAFLIDVSGSMSDEIQFLQSEMIALMEATRLKYPEKEIRAGVVYFQGHGDPDPISFIPLTNDAYALTTFIDAVGRRGGDDEAIDLAMSTMVDQFGWTEASAKLAFVMTDEVLQNVPENRDRLRDAIRQSASMGIKLVPIGCSGANKELEYIMRSMAVVTGSSYVALTDDSGVGNGHVTPTASKIDVQSLSNIILDLVMRSVDDKSCEEAYELLEDRIAPELALNKSKGASWENKNIEVFPNPTSGEFKIKGDKKNIAQVFICDSAGRIVKKCDIAEGAFDISAFADGNYFVLCQDKQGAFSSSQLIKTNSSVHMTARR